MKKSIIAILLAAVMVLFCACGSEPAAEKLPVPETPAGWAKHVEGSLHVFYPETYTDVTANSGVAFQVMDEVTGNNINIVKDTVNLFDIDDLNDSYVNNVLDQVTAQLDSVYETTLGVECQTSGKNKGFEKKTFGNGKCACIAYSVELNVPDYATSMTTEFYQVIYVDDEAAYTITYTCFPEEGADAATYYADALELLFVE